MAVRDTVEQARLAGAEQAMADKVYCADAHKKSAFRTAAEEAPFMIRTLGLGAGIAALASKEGERLRLAAMISSWLLQGCGHLNQWHINIPSGDDPTSVKELLRKIAGSSREQYRAGQIEALGYAVWIKRLAQAFCRKQGNS